MTRAAGNEGSSLASWRRAARWQGLSSGGLAAIEGRRAHRVHRHERRPGLWFVYRDPFANLGIVRVGVAYKAAYSGLALYYLVIGQLPSAFFIPWAVVDLFFLVGFVMFLQLAARR